MAGRAPSHREPPPAPERLVRWPDDWGVRFLVTVDVEEEFDWCGPFDPANRSTTAMRAFPDAHRRFAGFGAPLLMMVDHPVATDPAGVEAIRAAIADGRSEVGAQLHAWVTPPFEGGAESYQGRLPRGVEAAKIDRLTDALTSAFGARPRVFRAGRYGLGPHTRALLAARGYRVDSSVRARHDYSGDGGPDFRAVGPHAYLSHGLVELPLTTVFIGRARGWGPRAHGPLGRVPGVGGAASRLGLLSRVALTPEGMPVADALRAVDAAVADEVRLLVFGFHSPSLVPGHTPYVRDGDDLRRFWAWWGAVFARLERLGVRAASLGEVLDAVG